MNGIEMQFNLFKHVNTLLSQALLRRMATKEQRRISAQIFSDLEPHH